MTGNPSLSVQSSLSARRRRPKILPIDIDQFLADTMLMDPADVGIYMRLLTHLWLNGSLPQDRNILARIAGVRPEEKHASSIAWSIAQSIAQASDLVLEERGKWVAKRQKAHEKAVKAAQARWEKYRQTKGEKADAPSITPSMQARRVSLVLSSQEREEPGGAPPEPPMGETQAKEEVKAKPVRNDSAAPVGNREDVTGHKGASARTYPPPNSSSGHFKQDVNSDSAPVDRDDRFGVFREELWKFWRAQNPDLGPCPWIKEDKRALNHLLAGSPTLEIEGFQSILRNRAASEINPVAPPRSWLGDAVKFAEGPLDRYGKPLKLIRQI